MDRARDQPSGESSERTWVYAGFWIRVWASVIDSALLLIVLFPLLSWLVPEPGHSMTGDGPLFTPGGQINYQALGLVTSGLPGPLHILLYWILPAIVVVLFWLAREATPGKMAIHARIVDARTGQKPALGRLVLRYLGYYVSTLPLALGLIWVGIDARKQGWHDKLARTVVIRPRRIVEATAHFPDAGPAGSVRHAGWNNES